MDIINKSRKLAFLLRHDRNYAFDEHGWRKVSDLVEYHGFTMDELYEIVETNNKQRFEFSDDKKLIRARQGHSIAVDVELEKKLPPDILYHGTAVESVESILSLGIESRSRLHVHLSARIETAINIGKRHGTPVVVMVDAKRMSEDGFVFYQSRNGVWLTSDIPSKYLRLVTNNK